MRQFIHMAAGFLLLVPAVALAAAEPATDQEDPKSAGAPAAAVVRTAPRPEHANPRLKLSYRNFGISNLDGSPVALHGAQLDAYPLSRRFFRIGIELEGGKGEASLGDGHASLSYGLGGLSAGFQYPARVTPFVEGRFAAGALAGSYSGTIGQVGGVPITMSNASAVTVMYLGGIDAGVEVYAFSRFYLSAAIGWAHPVYTGPDYAAMQANPTGGMHLKQIAADTFTFKVGIGI